MYQVLEFCEIAQYIGLYTNLRRDQNLYHCTPEAGVPLHLLTLIVGNQVKI